MQGKYYIFFCKWISVGCLISLLLWPINNPTFINILSSKLLNQDSIYASTIKGGFLLCDRKPHTLVASITLDHTNKMKIGGIRFLKIKEKCAHT